MRLIVGLPAARFAQLDKRQSAEREVAGSNPGWTNTLCDIYKCLDFLVFSDKDGKL